MYKFIFLFWEDINLGSLSFVDNRYVFIKNDENFRLAEANGCPLYLLGIDAKIMDDLPVIFWEHEISSHREDLVKKYDIRDSDNRFERLYKLALHADDFSKDGFWILSSE